MATTKRFLVGGGTGFIGSHVVKNLLRMENHEVIVVTRDEKRAKQTLLASSPEIANNQNRVQFKNWKDLDNLKEPVYAGINLTGRSLMDKRWTPEFKKELYDSRLNPTRLLIQHLSKQTAEKPHFIGTSAVGYYPVDQDTIFTEYTPVEKANNVAGELCEAIESTIKEEIVKCGNVCSYSIMRPGIVLGIAGALPQLALPFLLGFLNYPNGGTQPFPYIHVEDLSNLFIFVASSSSMHGVVNGTAPEIITFKQLSQALAKHLHRSFLPMFPIPEFIINLALGKDRAFLITHGQKVSPEKALKAGFQFQYPNIDSALANICKQITFKGMLQAMKKKD